ncbi:MAG: nitrate reductase cytochrome c-type subunit [Zoogloeaceae bacterium]|jgi:cytochrome c-type protein NapB|nr:nitrate reductase cytochrome c-type subunit [Zoogloeaceae bacterium]
MKKQLFTAALLGAFCLGAIAQESGFTSLRTKPVESDSTVSTAKISVIETTPFERSYVQQPPLISHTVDTYPVTLQFNKCMDCHSWEHYREEGATKVPQSHFKTADGQDLQNISPRRYFCLQCHVPQTDARPLVGNTFERARSAR